MRKSNKIPFGRNNLFVSARLREKNFEKILKEISTEPFKETIKKSYHTNMLNVNTTSDGWAYINSFNSNNDIFCKEGNINDIILCTERCIKETYLQPMMIAHTDAEIIYANQIRHYNDNGDMLPVALLNKLTNQYKRIGRIENLTDFNLRIELDGMAYIIRYMYDIEIDDMICRQFMYIEYNDKAGVITVRRLIFKVSNNLMPICDTSWINAHFYSKNPADAKNYAKHIINNLAYEMTKIASIMIYAFKTYLNDDSIRLYTNPVHTNIEMDLFRKLIQNNRYGAKDDLKLYNMKINRNADYCNITNDRENQDDENKKVSETVSRIISIRDYPINDLDEKEYNRMLSFCIDNELIDRETREFNHIDIVEYLQHPRYGNTIRFHPNFKESPNIDFDDEDSLAELLTFTYDLDKENDQLGVHIIYEEESFIIDEVFNFVNLHNFTINTSICDYRLDYYLCPNTLPKTLSVITDKIPPMLNNFDTVIGVLYDILMMYIVAYLRPKRISMVNIIEHKPRVHHNDNQEPEDSDIVITHILKTATAAKRFISEMSTKVGCSTNREYVIAEWPRSGHFRTLKSGKTVWIPPTTCHRNKPMTEKEIHIKL